MFMFAGSFIGGAASSGPGRPAIRGLYPVGSTCTLFMLAGYYVGGAASIGPDCSAGRLGQSGCGNQVQLHTVHARRYLLGGTASTGHKVPLRGAC